MAERKFDSLQINEIRNLSIKKVSYAVLSKKYNTTISVIASIIKLKTYKNIPFCNIEINIENETRTKKARVLENYPKIYVVNKAIDYLSGVYIIRNKINNKCYVGSSVKIRTRLNWHYNSLIKNSHTNKHLQYSFNKYGKDSFEFIPLLNCPKEYNTKLEQWIKDKSCFKCDYNIAENCKNPMLGVSMSESSKDKLREKAKKRRHTPETIKNLSILKIKKINSDPVYKSQLLRNIVKNPKGERNPNSTLKEFQVIEIRNRIKNGEKVCDFKHLYKCSSSMLYEIKNNRNWKITV